MIPCIRVKPGVQFTIIAPGGFVLLAAVENAARIISHDITITSACDGIHSGPSDPHHRGEAIDCRTKDLPDPQLALEAMQDFAGERFFFWIEDAGQENEHIHGQVKKGTVYPPTALDTHEEAQDAATAT